MLSRPWPLWLLTCLVLIGFPVLNLVYWDQVLQSGVLPAHADSIGIPIFNSILTTIVLSPPVLGVAWLCLRRYNPDTRLASWRRDRPYRSVLITILFGAGATLVTVAILEEIMLGGPWYEYLWPTYFSLWLPWLLSLRAAAIEQFEYEPTLAAR